MLRVAIRVREDALEAVMDELMPRLPQGVHERDLGGGEAEIAFYGAAGELPERAALEAAVGDALLEWGEQEVPDDHAERRRLFGRTWDIDGRLLVRGPDDPPGTDGLPEIVIEPVSGAFGTGAHPTTRMCLRILLDMPPAGAFADLGCGAGVLAITAAGRGFSPVIAVDHEPRSVAAAARNATRNGVAVEAMELDLTQMPPPGAPTIAANVPLAIHQAIAPRIAPTVVRVIVSGIIEGELAAARALYETAGLRMADHLGADGWQAALMERRA
jgi:ribosomal protein L11 methyltransferase